MGWQQGRGRHVLRRGCAEDQEADGLRLLVRLPRVGQVAVAAINAPWY